MKPLRHAGNKDQFSSIADRLRRPLVIVCKQAKGFGRLAQFEGIFEAGDACASRRRSPTDGINKEGFRSALEKAEASVVETFVLFNYGIFPSGRKIASLMTLGDVIGALEAVRYMDSRTLDEVKTFAADAPRWSKRNGGIGGLSRSPDAK